MPEIDKRQIKNFLLKKSDYYQFECDNENYFFSADRLQIYKLNNPFIKEYIRINNSEQDKLTTYLSVDQIKRIYNFLLDEMEKNPQPDIAKDEGETIKSLVLNISDSCNLNCTYCFAIKEMGWTNKFMDLAKAKKAIQFLVSQNPQANRYSIVLFGGEPFLNFKLIKQIAQYCEDHIIKKLGKKVSFSATTNGTILNAEIIEILKKHTFHLIVSLDGPKEIHDKHRPFSNNRGSFDKILKNIEILKKHKILFSLRATITSDCENIVEIADFLEKIGVEFGLEFVQNTEYKASESVVYTETKINNLEKQYEELISYYYNKIINKQKIFCKNIVEALSRIHYQSAKEIACNAGRSIITINHDGAMYTCQNISNIPETKIGALN